MASSDKIKEKVPTVEAHFKNVSRRKYLIGPITFLHLLGFSIYNGTTTLYYPYSIGRELFPNSSMGREKSSICNTNTNTTDTDNGKIIQSEVATFLIYVAISAGIPCILANLFFGSISDRFEIKRLLLFPAIGILISQFFMIAFMYFDIELYYLLIPSSLLGLTGETFALIQFTLSYASKITKNGKERTVAMGLMEICIGMGILIGGVIAGYIIQAAGYIWSVVTACLVIFCNLILMCLLPEIIERKTKEPWRCLDLIKSFQKSLQFYYSKSYSGIRWKYNIGLAILVVGWVTVIGRNNTEVLFIISPPFCLNPIDVGWFHAARGIMQHGIAMVLIRVFVTCLSPEAMAIIGAISGVIAFVVEGITSSKVVLFLTTVIGFGTSMGIVMMRVIMSRETPGDKQGALFGGMAAVQTACTFFGSMLFSAIYKDTVYFYKGTIFLIMAGLVFLSLILCLLLVIIPKFMGKEYDLQSKKSKILELDVKL
ncbi:solute carrier family 46 member 3-like [Ostrea edulis]|uniref:solute carrier family 46 member 3-like n=1 Tax=Ostrea edulis TaxID=37623 RepID=UPI0024B000D2|nr:solute carrier family 46 member 3-like [Ostrea edulis]XP_048733881.2 solute carrier family 46 member 3-like [Ostrea edulis]